MEVAGTGISAPTSSRVDLRAAYAAPTADAKRLRKLLRKILKIFSEETRLGDILAKRVTAFLSPSYRRNFRRVKEAPLKISERFF